MQIWQSNTPIPEHTRYWISTVLPIPMSFPNVAFDERKVAESSHDLTTFQTPFKALRIVTLPMGWTNSVPIMHNDITYILQPKILTSPFPILMTPPSKVQNHAINLVMVHTKQSPTVLPVWEHFESFNCVIQCMKYCGGTFSSPKLFLCISEITVVGY